MQPTIRDVARQAGVSIATVSRVLREHDNVTPGTRDKVMAAVAELGFTPSVLGRSLAERRHAANGIVFPDLSGPYYAEVVLGYEAVAAELGRSVLILSTHGRKAAPAMVTDLSGRCDGLVILGRTVSDEVVSQISARGLPVVLLARPQVGDIDSVKSENTRSAETLVRHLLADGHRRLTFIGDPDSSPDLVERWDGVQSAVTDIDDVDLTRLSPDGFGVEAGARVTRGVLESNLPDALVFANDELALGALEELRRQKIDVPGDVAVTGWDDVMAARYAGLTTVRQPMRELGATAAQLLDRRIRGARSKPRHDVLPTELVVRASCAHHQEESP